MYLFILVHYPFKTLHRNFKFEIEAITKTNFVTKYFFV